MFMCFCIITSAQEICNNGIDDDGDGIVDIQDPDCICGNIIPDIVDGDFEDYSCCPQGITGIVGSGMYCLDDGWGLANMATADYFNTCGWTGSGGIPTIPMPIPSGEGGVGMISSPTWNENVGLCMPLAMIPGEDYDISFWVGFNDDGFYDCNLNVEFGLYGSNDCNSFPSNVNTCMSGDPDWYELETFLISGTAQNTWRFFSTTFTATAAAQAIAIGHTCDFADANPSDYHFIDNIVIDGVFVQILNDFDASVTGDCINGVFLEASDPAETYQWYLDGVLVPGATSNPYQVPVDANGVYQVFMEFADGTCAISVEVDVDTELMVLDILGDVNSVECPGDENGSISITNDSPNVPLDILWSNGETTADISNLAPGNYTVTVTDTNGCFGEETFTIDVPPPLTLSVYVEQPTQDNPFGYADLTIGGGTMPYIIAWDNGNDELSDNMLLPGVYTVLVTDANGCEISITFEIFATLVATVEFTPESCLGFCDGTITITEINGGMPPYDIDWDINGNDATQVDLCEGPYEYIIEDAFGTMISGIISIDEGTFMELELSYQEVLCEADETTDIDLEVIGGTAPFIFNWDDGSTTEDIEEAESGFYGVTVNDASGCEIITDFYIDFANPISVDEEIEIAPCGTQGEGAINLTVFGGTAPYDFNWSNGADTEDLTDLFAGIYDLTITDLYGCSFEGSYEVTSNTDLVVTEILTQTICPTDLDGSISLDIQGGTAPIDILWSNSETTNEISGLAAGSYTVTVSDALNCTWINTFTIASDSELTVTEQITNVDCFEATTGAIELDIISSGTITGYNWDNGSVTQDLSNLAAGDYNLQITDSYGCEYMFAYTLTEQPAFEVTETITDVNCYGEQGGDIQLDIVDIETYDFLWSDGSSEDELTNQLSGSYELTITNALGCEQFYSYSIDQPTEILSNTTIIHAGCDAAAQGGTIQINPTGGEGPYVINWSNGEMKEEIQNLAADIYLLTITDSRGCVLEESHEVNAATPFSVTETILDAQCFESNDGEISLSVMGGTAPFEYAWSTGEATSEIDQLFAGMYSVVVTDGNGCEEEIFYNVEEPAEMVITPIVDDARCFGEQGEIEINITGGTPPYDILWSTGETTNQINGTAGSYDLSVMDANDCLFMETYTIMEPDQLTSVLQGFTLPGVGGNDGTATLVISGGTMPYNVTWSNGSTGEFVDDLEFGVTTAVIMDANGCEISAVVVLTPEDLEYEFSLTSNDCFGACIASISLEIVGGAMPFEVIWNDGTNGLENVDLCAGIYSASIVDALGNTIQTEDFEITEPPSMNLVGQVNNISCVNAADGSISGMVTGGTAPYSFMWSNGETTEQIEDLEPGVYELLVTDAEECQMSETFEIPDLTELAVEFIVQMAECDSDFGRIIIEGDLIEGYGVLLDGIEQTISVAGVIENVPVGIHELAYQISPACVVALGQVEIEAALDITLSTDQNTYEVKLDELVELEIMINSPDLLVDYTIDWIATNALNCISVDQQGGCLEMEFIATESESILVVLTDENGCVHELVFNVRVIEPPILVMPNIFSPNGDSENENLIFYTSRKVEQVNRFSIYDRWGNVMHEQENGSAEIMSWNGIASGQRVAAGVYIYQVEVRMIDGAIERFTGDLTLVR